MSCPSATTRDGRSFVRAGAYVRSRSRVMRKPRCSFVPIYRCYYINVPRYERVLVVLLYFVLRVKFSIDSAKRTASQLVAITQLQLFVVAIYLPRKNVTTAKLGLAKTRAIHLPAADILKCKIGFISRKPLALVSLSIKCRKPRIFCTLSAAILFHLRVYRER